MQLGFKTKFPWGEQTHFVQKILSCVKHNGHAPKRHTIRRGNRFKKGNILHMATGVRTSQYNQFNTDIDELQLCKAVQNIFIDPINKKVRIAGRDLSTHEIDVLSQNDGFENTEQFWYWFAEPMTGQLIHWTDLLY